jgi:hypothetical protein
VGGISEADRLKSTQGSVRAIVTIGNDGKTERVDAITPDTNLAEEVRGYLIRHAEFDGTCAGKRVELIFTFKQDGEPEYTPPVWVKFRPPNHFIIITRPKEPEIN